MDVDDEEDNNDHKNNININNENHQNQAKNQNIRHAAQDDESQVKTEYSKFFYSFKMIEKDTYITVGEMVKKYISKI